MSVAQKMFIETIDVTIPHTIEDTNKEEFHQMYKFIYDPFCNRWYAPKYLLSAVQSPVQRTVKLRSCRQAIVWRMEKLTLHIIAVLISHRSEHP